MATKTINSDKSESKVGSSLTKLYTSTRITYTTDEQGVIDPTKTKYEILYYDAPLSPGLVAATRTGTETNWSFKNKPLSDKPILGEDAQKSLSQGVLKNTTDTQISDISKKEGLTPEQQKAISLSKNTASDADTNAQQQLVESDLNNANFKEKTRTKFDLDLRYPSDIQIDHQDVIKFSMIEFTPKPLNSDSNQGLGSFGERPPGKVIGSVFLPVPAGISDTNAVSWSSDQISPFQKMLVDIAYSAIKGGGAAAANTIGSKIEATAESSGEIQEGLAAAFTQNATGASNLLARTKGAISNPNMELLFNAPSLRPFNFTFKLSARGTKDREQIRKIIRFFKQGMSVKRTQSQLFLKAPYIFKIQYLHGKDADHPYINRIKECALQTFTVNYTPEGNYMTFADGLMTSYEISMQFQELEPIFNDDYGKLDENKDNIIGY